MAVIYTTIVTIRYIPNTMCLCPSARHSRSPQEYYNTTIAYNRYPRHTMPRANQYGIIRVLYTDT